MPPVAAVVTGFFLVALPILLLMGIWTAVTMWRLVFPDDELPEHPATHIAQAEARGEAVPVGLADIVERERRRVRAAQAHRQRVADGEQAPRSPLEEDLWRRRN